MPREKTNKLNIYRLKNGIELNDINLTQSQYDLDFEDEEKRLFVLRREPSKPIWCEYFESLIDPEDIPENSTASFVYLHKNGSRVYAITGGHGYTRIENIVEEDFGIELAIRMIGETKISALNQQPLKGTTRQIFRAVNGYNPIFDRENYNRMLRFIQGKGDFEGRTFSVSGRSSISIRTAKSISNISEVFAELERIEARPPNFILPKSYKEITDKKVIENLDGKMISDLNEYWSGRHGRENFYLEFKDPSLQFKCEQFGVLSPKFDGIFSDFDLDIIKSRLIESGITEISTKDNLKSIRFLGQDETGQQITPISSMYDCLTAEVQWGNHEYIKFGKKWLQLLPELKEYLNEEMKKISVRLGVFPTWDKGVHPEESDFNRHFSSINGFTFMDAQFVHFENRSKLELCDSYDFQSNTFYHVKETWGAKSSYLYLQGSTSLEYFLQSRSFFEGCQKKWPTLFQEKNLKGHVCFGIADEKANRQVFPNNLTYFAKLNLIKTYFDIKNLNYEVHLCPISLN